MTTQLTCCETEKTNGHGECSRGSHLPAESFRPAIDIADQNDAVLLQVDLPGADESEIELTLEKNALKLRGVRAAEAFPGYELVHQEHGARNYEREFRLSETLNREAVEATMREGVLELRIPRLEPAGPQKIAIKAKGE